MVAAQKKESPMSQPRYQYAKLSHDALKPLSELAAVVKASSLSPTLIDLVNLRASQLNGCAFCVDMHVKEARLHGERDLRVHHVAVWQESPLFTDQEKAALAWVEAVTRLDGAESVPDAAYDRVRTHFGEKEISDLTLAIGVINVWNRLAISSRAVPGSADKAFGLEKAGY
jgi:AhpD family alkylhydroperoxidase